MAEQLNSKMATSELQSVDLDNLFSFLSDVQSTKSNQIIDEIGEQMDELVEDLDVELETVIQQEMELGLNNIQDDRNQGGANSADRETQQQRTAAKLGQPSLPEPTEPPPPPPLPLPIPMALDDDSTSTNNSCSISAADGEPIYESVLPRDENGPSSPVLINVGSAIGNGDLCGSPPPVPTSKIVKETTASSPPPRPDSRNSNGHHHHQLLQSQPVQPASYIHEQQQPVEREQRRKFRVERKLQELEESKEILEPDTTYHDIVEFAQNYFNNHERSPEGTIIATLTRKSRGKSLEFVPKYEMVTYYKGSSIPNSHIHMYDPDNVNVACSVFRVSARSDFAETLPRT